MRDAGVGGARRLFQASNVSCFNHQQQKHLGCVAVKVSPSQRVAARFCFLLLQWEPWRATSTSCPQPQARSVLTPGLLFCFDTFFFSFCFHTSFCCKSTTGGKQAMTSAATLSLSLFFSLQPAFFVALLHQLHSWGRPVWRAWDQSRGTLQKPDQLFHSCTYLTSC